MARIAVALPAEVEERLVPEAERYGHSIIMRASSAGDLAERIGSRGRVPELALVASTHRYLTDRLLSACDDAGVRLVALVGGETERRHAASLGLRETADAASTWSDLETAIAAHTPGGDALPHRRGTVVAVWGPAGAPGRTSLAVNIAAELAAAGHSVVLADADTYGASVAPALGILDEAPGFAAACRLAGADSLTQEELERISDRYRSGHGSFRVLTGIGRPSRWPELSAARVTGTIEQCRRWMDYVVIDTGFSLENDEEISTDLFAPRRNAAGLAALGAADRVIAVGAADPVGLSRFLRAHVDLVEAVADGRVLVAMNKVRASAIGMNPLGQVAQTLSRFGGIDSAAMIPFDQPAFDAALLGGQTLADAAPRSAARAAIRELVESRLLDTPPAGRRSRRHARRARAGRRSG